MTHTPNALEEVEKALQGVRMHKCMFDCDDDFIASCYAVNAAIKTLRAYMATQDNATSDDGWKTIDSAPKDGTDVLVGCYNEANSWCASDMWSHGHERWLNNWRCSKALTHWMPLPKPPTMQGGE